MPGTAARRRARPASVGADRFVLLGLDRGDDVAHAAGAGPLERGEQRALADHREPGGVGRVAVEDLVVEPDELAAGAGSGEEVAAPDHAHRLDRRRPVERLGDRRPPVDDERLLLLVGDREPPDVEALVGGGATTSVGCGRDAAEAQRRLADVEGGEAAPGHVVGGVALEAGLVGAARADLGVAPATRAGGVAHGVETRVRRVDVPPAPRPARGGPRRRPPLRDSSSGN